MLLQYRLWWGEGGWLESRRLDQQVADYERENAALRARNAELAKQVLDLKSGQTVLEQRAREELGLTREDEVFYQFAPKTMEPAVSASSATKILPPTAPGVLPEEERP